MLATDFFTWNQFLLFMLFFCIWLFGAGALLFVGGHFIIKSPKATFWWSVITHIVFSFIGGIVFFVIQIYGINSTPGYVSHHEFHLNYRLGTLFGLGLGIPAILLVIKTMFKVNYKKAILAWLPGFWIELLVTFPLVHKIAELVAY